MTEQSILFFPHTINKWFSCDFVDVYRPILENASGKFYMIDKYINNRTINIIDSMNEQYNHKGTFVEPIDLSETINMKSIESLRQYIIDAIDFDKFTDIILTHGHTFDSYHNEGKMWLKYQTWKTQESVKLSSYEWDFAFIYVLAELCIEHNVTIHSIWFDPLQVKLNYIPGLQIKHYSFHAISDPWEFKEYQRYYQDSYREVTVGQGNVLCRSSKAYLSGYIGKLQEFLTTNPYDFLKLKTLKNAFGMSLTWKAPFREKFVHSIIMFNNPHDNESYYMCYKTSRPKYHSITAMSQNPTLPYSEYVEKVSEATSTIMLPSMDPNSFSVIRFVESISNGTVPLIFNNNKYLAGLDYEQSIIDVYNKYDLFLNANQSVSGMYNEIKRKSNIVHNHYVEIIQELQNTKYLRNLANPETYKQEMLMMLPAIKINEKVEYVESIKQS